MLSTIPVTTTDFTGFAAQASDIFSDPIPNKFSPSSALLTSLAAETGTVSLFTADPDTVSKYTDAKGTINGDSVSSSFTPTTQTQTLYFSRTTSSNWTTGGVQFNQESSLQITSSLTLRVLLRFTDRGNVIEHAVSGETSATNFLYRIFAPDTSDLSGTGFTYFHESGSGSNNIVRFVFPSVAQAGDVMLLSVVRHDLGTGNCNIYGYQNGVRLNVASVSGLTNNTTFATGALPTGGSSGKLFLGSTSSGSFNKLVQIIAGVSGSTASEFDTKEAAIATSFGF